MVTFVKIPIVLKKNSMTARMKKLTSISMLVVVLALLVVLGVVLTKGPVREPVTIYGSEVDLTAPGGTFGNATLTIRGDEFVGTVRVTREEVDGITSVPKGEGEYVLAAKHFFDFGDGNTLTTIGAEYIVPTEEDPLVFTPHGDMEITEATGLFEGLSGELRLNGQIDRNPDVMEATFHANGVVSGYRG